MHTYENFGVMLDVSRNGVMKVSMVKKYIDYLSMMGYNFLELYAEDMYEIKDEPYFGYMRGAYTAVEIKEIDSYAKAKGIELIPCVQTLAHFTNMRKVPYYWDLFDIDDILLIDDERVYAFLDKMFKNLAENFTSRKVNIGMDEAHNVGLGQYLAKHGYHNRSELLVKHLNKVSEIAKKYGFTCHMWSDMFFRLISGGLYNANAVKDVHVSPEIAAQVPDDISLIYWDYYTPEKEKHDIMFDRHFEFGRDIWFAGGAWTWMGFAPLNEFSLRTMKAAMQSVIEHQVSNVFVTVWGDNGKECSYFSVLPSLYATRRFADGCFDMEIIKAEFKEKFGFEFDAWLALDLPNEIRINGEKNLDWNCLCKTLCYNDPFLGLRDSNYQKIDAVPYQRYARILAKKSKQAGEFSYIFQTLSKLCTFLEYKAGLGIRTRTLYQEKNIEGLTALLKDYKLAIKALRSFTKAYKTQWMYENKAFGWEVQEIRLGGLEARLVGCLNRLEEFLAGKIECIEELEQQTLPNLHKNGFMYQNYREIATPSEL